MEKKLLYEEYIEYLKNEISIINTDYSNIVLEKIKKLNFENSKEINNLVISVNSVYSSNIPLFWEWYRYIKL